MLTRRGRLLVLALAVVLVAAGTSVAIFHDRSPVLVVVDPACPPLLEGVSDAADDYGDTVHWAGETYWLSEGKARAGAQLGLVTCSVSADLGDRGWRVAPGKWPDGTSTSLPRGTVLYAPAKVRARPAIVARTAGGDRLYCLDDQAGPPTC